MKKRIISALLSTIVCIAVLPLQMFVVADDTYCPFSGGSGTEDDPYQISTAYDLHVFSELVADSDTATAKHYAQAHYIQTKDIDLKSVSFIPIGTHPGIGFSGCYNGNYCDISNLYIEVTGGYIGLFGWVSGGSIENLSVYGDVTSKEREGKVTLIGGIAGEICDEASISNCSFMGTVTTDGTIAGGVAGQIARSGSISHSFFNGNVSAANGVGGVVGYVNDINTAGKMEIVSCYAAGKVIDTVDEVMVGGITSNFATQNAETTITTKKNYYLSTACNGAVNGGTYEGCSKLSADLLKGAAELLGTPFVDNCETDGFNDGYPIFEWQSTPYQFKGGGTAEDPYQISSKDELKKMRDLVNSTYFNADYSYAHYIQTSDIDLENELWIPIGKCYVGVQYTANVAFRGCYNGNYNKIENLMINDTLNYSGLFGRVIGENVVIKNLSVVNGSVTSTANYVGGLCGEIATNAKVIYCSYNGSVNGNDYVGGIVGKFCQDGKVENSYHIGSVNANKYAGGIAGFIWDDSWNVTIKNCYHAGKVESTDGVAGGIVGNSERESTNTLLVDVVNCYYLNDGNLPSANGTFTTCDATGLTSNLMKRIAADLGSPFITSPSDSLNDGYPVFAWQLDTWGKGDINFDGEVSVADAVYLQGYLLGRFSFNEIEWDAANLIDDDNVSAFDLCLLKRLLIEVEEGST